MSPEWTLVERDRELEQLRAALAAARAGDGAIVVIEAPAGHGKTELLRALRIAALEMDVCALTATGAELERDFPFGVVLQLFGTEVYGAAGKQQASLFEGAAQAARAVVDSGAASPSLADVSFSRLHGLYWLAANFAAERPVVFIVDDAHWADAPSMRFVDVLSRRLEGLPILLAVGIRPAEPGTEADILDALVVRPDVQVLRPAPLSATGIADLLRRTLGDQVEEPFIEAALDVTGGSPMLLRELLRTLDEAGFGGRGGEVDALRRVLPGNVGRLVTSRLRRLSPRAAAVARSVAILGDGAGSADVAQLAELPAQDAADAQADLAAAGILRADSWGFVHPMVREAVHADLVESARGDWHRRAAAIRTEAGAEPAEIAAHLLNAEPGGQRWAAEALAHAGRRALLDGTPDVAVRLLRRALAEPPPDDARADILLALGQAEARSGARDAVRHLAEAAACGDAQTAVRADRLRAQVLVLHERAGESIEILRRALERAGDRDPALALELEDDLVDVLAHHAPLRAEYLQRLEAGSAAERPTLVSHLAFVRAMTGAPRGEVIELARRALAPPGGDGTGRFMHFYAFEALMAVEAADEGAATLRDATAMAQRLGSRVVAGPLSYMPSSWAAWQRRFGDLREAQAQAQQGLDLAIAARTPALVVTLRSALAAILVDRGQLDEAEALFAQLPATETGPGLREIHGMRGRLQLQRGRAEEALAELERAIELERARLGDLQPRAEPPDARPRARRAEPPGRGVRGRRPPGRRCDPPRRVRRRRARLGLALTLPGREALEELRRAADVARGSPSQLIRAETVGELGLALRRAGERVEAREVLAEARELAHRCGASALEARLLDELVIAGARPRRVPLAGVESLTAAERRVADLAAAGMRNREIAETLFVTVKTVEVHLGRAYGKLDIKSRAQLAAALGAERA